MPYLKTFEECEAYVRIATLQPLGLCFMQIPVQEALQVYTDRDYLPTIRMLNALINARDDLDQLPFDSILKCDMILYRVKFATITVHITTHSDLLIIVLAI